MISVPLPDAECQIVRELPELDLQEMPGSGLRFAEGVIELSLRDIGRYRMEKGRRISILPEPGVSSETLIFYLKATPFGLLVLQRGELPLHASAVVPPGGHAALLLAGDSGAGKSTSAALLVKKSWHLLNDDITRITFEGEIATAWPGFASLKLGDQSLRMLGLENAALPRTPGVKEKAYWHLEGLQEAVPVGALVILRNPQGPPTPPRRLAGMKLLEQLYLQTFRPWLVRPLGFHREHFTQVTRFAGKIPCFLLEGNQSLPPDELVQLLERCVEQA